MRQHEKFLSFGESIGTPHCLIPTALFAWRPTRQPIVLDWWDTFHPAVREVYNDVMSWQPDGGSVTVNGVVLWR